MSHEYQPHRPDAPILHDFAPEHRNRLSTPNNESRVPGKIVIPYPDLLFCADVLSSTFAFLRARGKLLCCCFFVVVAIVDVLFRCRRVIDEVSRNYSKQINIAVPPTFSSWRQELTSNNPTRNLVNPPSAIKNTTSDPLPTPRIPHCRTPCPRNSSIRHTQPSRVQQDLRTTHIAPPQLLTHGLERSPHLPVPSDPRLKEDLDFPLVYASSPGRRMPTDVLGCFEKRRRRSDGTVRARGGGIRGGRTRSALGRGGCGGRMAATLVEVDISVRSMHIAGELHMALP